MDFFLNLVCFLIGLLRYDDWEIVLELVEYVIEGLFREVFWVWDGEFFVFFGFEVLWILLFVGIVFM